MIFCHCLHFIYFLFLFDFEVTSCDFIFEIFSWDLRNRPCLYLFKRGCVLIVQHFCDTFIYIDLMTKDSF